MPRDELRTIWWSAQYKPGNPALFFYLLFTYFIPALVNWAVRYESPIYVNPESGFLSWLYGTFLFGIVLIFAFFPAGPRTIARDEQRPLGRLHCLPVKGLSTVLLIVVGVSVMGVASGLSRWRYLDEGLSSSLNLSTLLYVLAPNFLEALLFVLVFFRDNTPPAHRRWLLLLVATCMALTASGIGPAISALLAIIAFAAPSQLRNVLFHAESAPSVDIRPVSMWRLVFFGSVCVLLVGVAYVVGDSIKRGLDLPTVIDEMGENDSVLFMNYLIGRFSVNWYSFVASLHHFVDSGLGGQFDNLQAPISNAWFRLTALTGGWMDVERPLNGSLARINYTLINLYPFNDREGTTPGLIPSFLIAFPVGLAPFALAAYLSVYHAIQMRLRRRMLGRPTWIGEILLLYFTSIFFASPVDFLLLFDPMLFTVFAWIYLGYGMRLDRGLNHAQCQG